MQDKLVRNIKRKIPVKCVLPTILINFGEISVEMETNLNEISPTRLAQDKDI